MKRFLTVWVAIIALSPRGAGDGDARAIVTRLNKAWLAAYNVADFNRLAALYTKDAVVMPEGREPIRGRAAIREFFAEDFKNVPSRSISLTSLRVEASSSVLVDSGQYRYEGTDVDGKAVHIRGNYNTVFRKIGATWQTAVDIWNVANVREKPALTVRPLTDRQFKRTLERLGRGRYLVNGIGECFACHGPYDLKAPGWPPVRGKEGSGLAFRSGVVAANLTPDRKTGIGNWTDDMLARAIREGVGHDGHLLDPTIMPYEFYRSMSDEDLASVIVYLRSLPPIRNALPPLRTRENLVAPYAIPIYKPVPQPDVSTQVKRGAYLMQLGACQWCHTLRDENRVTLPGLEFAGGDLIKNSDPPYDQVTSANLTPDSSGISYYDESQFLKTMHTGKVGARKISPIMPWWFFGQMNDDDLKAIFAYLRTLKPVHHRVDNNEPIAYCRICKRKHHGGALN